MKRRHIRETSALPEGVRPDNDEPARTHAGYTAPDMATPRFAAAPAGAPSLNASARRIVRERVEEIIEEEDDDDDDDSGHRPSNGKSSAALMIAIAAILLALLALVFSMNRGQTPLCSSQPEWNQYNCRAR